jgi:hypothetical protein
MKQIKLVYIGNNCTLSNGVELLTNDLCTFNLINENAIAYDVTLDRTGEDMGIFYYSINSQWFIPLAKWKINK